MIHAYVPNKPHSHMRQYLLLLILLGQGLLCQGCTEGRNKQEAPVSAANTKASVPHEEQTPTDTILRHTIYTSRDSVRVIQLLAEKPVGNDVLYYARQFKGVPYVASTLEVADPEQLVVNLRQLDCTTLVETALALALTRREGGTTFEAYCHNLMRLRYRGGVMNGYLSRLHYFTWWMHDNMSKGLITEVRDTLHFTAPIVVDNHYMSQHPDKYKWLRVHPEWIDSIRSMERRYNGADGTFLPAARTNLTQQRLRCIHDGDLIAIVTRKDGIDYSHLGFAVWGKDGRLHLLNASSIHHKVVEEPKTLYQYLKEHPSSIGIRLFRLL